MAKPAVPDPMARRHLIEKEMESSQSLALAETYLADGRASEAVVFLVKAGADDRIGDLMEQAVSEGDAFLLKQIVDASRRECAPERWLALADAAEAVGKQRYAEMARRHARSSGE
jgi:hypothetical protein